ncbi:MAG: putative DNA binding domain-containing protein [Oscillospiraceae bacterium]|nr:putative DNA binding domain-containing protein [Oscillospiraceae bacterium]
MNIESNRIEYKSALTDKFEREVVAFLNYRDGGIIYIGVDDNGKAVGLDDADIVQLKIVDRIKNNILPNTLGLFDVVLERRDENDIIKIIVSSGTEKPYYIRQQGMSPSGCFLRVGSSVQPMTTAMIDEMYAKRTQKLTLSNIPSPRKDLTFEQLKIYYQEKGRTLNDNFAKNLELFTKDGQYNYVAYLLADNNSISIKVAKYLGTDKVDLIENGEYGFCSIIKAAKSVLDKLAIENTTFTKITSTTRQEKQMVNSVALREAVINAVVHNDYTKEIPPVFEIFSNRITVTSYGGLVEGYSKEDLLTCLSMPRNRELMRVFKDLELVEQLGSGMERILKIYNESIFKFTPNFLIVSFPFENGFISPSGEINGEINSKLILLEIEKNPRSKLSELSNATLLSERTVTRELKNLKDLGKIRRIGSNKAGYWEIV